MLILFCYYPILCFGTYYISDYKFIRAIKVLEKCKKTLSDTLD